MKEFYFVQLTRSARWRADPRFAMVYGKGMIVIFVLHPADLINAQRLSASQWSTHFSSNKMLNLNYHHYLCRIDTNIFFGIIF